MATIKNKIDFVVLVSVKNANPNGDPLDGNRPRADYAGIGEISDVCIKRKVRNRMQDMGDEIFVQTAGRVGNDKYKSLKERATAVLGKKPREQYEEMACQKWLDVRSFGQVFAYDKVSVGVRGPVTIHLATSVSPVEVCSMQITKSVNGEPPKTKKKQTEDEEEDNPDGMSSDRMGTKHFIPFGLYEIKGSINVQLAEKTGFSEEDAEKIKEALRTLFVNDASSARPDGSMEVCKLYWWKHNCKDGQYSAAKVHRSLKITPKQGVTMPKCVEDYDIVCEELPNLAVEVIDGI